MRRSLLRPTRLLLALLLCSAPLTHPLRAEQAGEAGLPASQPLVLEMESARARTYLRQPVSLSVTLYADGVQLRNIQYPTLSGTGFRIAPFGLPRDGSASRQGRECTSYRFETTLTPTRSGTLQLGQAELRLEQLAPASGAAALFGGTESRELTLRSPPLSLAVLPLPASGRPAGFSGAVGRFSVTRSAVPLEVEAGDPVTVRTVISGTGNLEAFSCTPVTGPGWRSYPPRGWHQGESLVCEQVVLPEAESLRLIPAAQVAFFDPDLERYRTAASAALPLKVSARRAAAPSCAPVAPAAPRTPGAAPPPADPEGEGGGPGYAAALCAALGLLALGFLLRRAFVPRAPAAEPVVEPVSAHAATEEGLEKAQAALATGDVELFYTLLFRTLQVSLASSLGLSASAVSAAELQPGLLPSRDCRVARQLLGQCDRVRYGRHRPPPGEPARDLQMLRELLQSPPS
jgi:hypothetical protein